MKLKLVNRDGGPHRLIEAVLLSYADLIKSNQIFTGNDIKGFTFPRIKMPHEKLSKKKREEIREAYKARKEEAKMFWEGRRRVWLEEQLKWILCDGFWFAAYDEFFSYNEDKLKEGFMNMVKKEISYTQGGLTPTLK